MDAEGEPTEEQVAAVQLRVFLDEKLGRSTPDIVRDIAAHGAPEPPERPPEQESAQLD